MVWHPRGRASPSATPALHTGMGQAFPPAPHCRKTGQREEELLPQGLLGQASGGFTVYAHIPLL